MRPKRGLLGPLFIVLALSLLPRRRLDVVEVRGRSMAPTLLPGDRLVVVRRIRPLRSGDIVLAADPRQPRRELIKRVASIDQSGVHLLGDDPDASTDGRAFGTVPASSIAWRAVLRYWPLARLGRVPSASLPGSS